MTRYGLIGSGMMGQEHIRNVALLDDAAVTAVFDPNECMREEAARLAGNATTYADYRDILSADVCDAFIIAAPNDTHHDLLIDVMAAGKPVLCEKPLCTTSQDCADILRRAGSWKAPVWVAMEYRYMMPVKRLIEERDAGTAGKPHMMSVREHRYPFLEKIGDWNRFNERTGGTMIEKCCHFWDLMRHVLQSDPIRVYASAGMAVNHLDERYDGRTPDIIDHGFVVVDFENGARGMLDLCMFAEGSTWQEVVSVTGEKARIDACVPGPTRFTPDGNPRHACLVVSNRATKNETVETVEVDETLLVAGDHHGSTFYQHEQFLELVRGRRDEPAVTLEDGAWAVLVGETAEESARTGQAINLNGLPGAGG